MPAKRKGLGRGLDALLPKAEKEKDVSNGKGVDQLSIDALNVSSYQPRKYIDPEAIAELASSVSQKGILQPLLVRPLEEGYEIVAGERRFRAAQQVGLKTVPAIIRDLTDRETLEIAIIENVQRENLNSVEEARAFKQLMDFGMNQEEVAKAVGKSRSAVANTLRLLQLGDAALSALEKRTISAGHARAILAQPESDKIWALERILENNLSVREAEGLKRQIITSSDRSSKKETLDGRYTHIETDLARQIGTKVKVLGGNKGRIELHFHSQDELQRLLELLHYQA